MERPRATAKVLARIGGLSGLYKVDLDPLFAALARLGDHVAERALVTVPHTFDRISITTRAPRDRMTGAVDAGQLRRFDRLAPGTSESEIEVELETDGEHIASSLRAPQSREIEPLCNDLEALGAAPLALDQLRGAGAQLGTPSSISDRRETTGAVRWTLYYRHRNETDTMRAHTRDRLLSVATFLGVTKPQCSVIEGLHDVLAKDAASTALLSLGADDMAPTLAVRWSHLRWETIIRMMLGFYPKLDVGKRLGELAGAFDAEQATAMELQLGTSEPPATRVAVAV